MNRSSDLDAIRRLARQAEAAVAGAGGDRVLRAGLDMQLAEIDVLAGELDRAIERIDAARVVFTESKDGRRASLAAGTEAELLANRNNPGDYARAVQLVRDSAADTEASFGRDHPLTRRARMTLAFWLLANKPDEARALYAELAKQPVPPDPHKRPRDTSVHARGRVLGPDGKPVAGATVNIGTFLICGDDGITIPTVVGEFDPTVLTTDAAGRFEAHVARHSIVVAHKDDLRAVPVLAGARDLTIRLAPGMSAQGTIHLPEVTPPPGSERAATIAARVARPDAIILGAGVGVLFQCLPHRIDEQHWAIRGLPPDPALRATIGVNSGFGERMAISVPIGAHHGTAIELTYDLDRPALDIIVRADSAAEIPTAQVIVFDGKLARLPTNGPELVHAMGASLRWSGGGAAPVVDATKTEAGAALYQKGDIHGRFAAFGPGPVTACVIPYAGDMRDPTFLRSLPDEIDPDVRCKVLQVAPSPRVQAFVIETPPMKRVPGSPK